MQQPAMNCCNMAKMKPSSCQAYYKWTTSDETWVWLWTCDETDVVNGRRSLHLSSRKGGQTSQTQRGSADCFLWHVTSGGPRISSPRPEHVPDCLQNGSTTPSRCSSLETASQMVSSYLASAPCHKSITKSLSFPTIKSVLDQASSSSSHDRHHSCKCCVQQ